MRTFFRENYDGYHFSPRSKDVYAPFSLLRALDKNDTSHYWFESGTSTALLEHLKRYPITRALDYDGVEVCENEFRKAHKMRHLHFLHSSQHHTLACHRCRGKCGRRTEFQLIYISISPTCTTGSTSVVFYSEKRGQKNVRVKKGENYGIIQRKFLSLELHYITTFINC